MHKSEGDKLRGEREKPQDGVFDGEESSERRWKETRLDTEYCTEYQTASVCWMGRTERVWVNWCSG
jgi:hypothetical protein